MRRNDDVPAWQQGAPFVQAIVAVLVGDHVDRRPGKTVVAQGCKQRQLIDEFAACGIDEIAAGEGSDLPFAEYRRLS